MPPRGLLKRIYMRTYVCVFISSILSGCGGGSSSSAPATSTGSISLFAGSLQGPGGADGIGSAAQFAGPEALAIDRSGNVWIADTANHTIRKLSPSGQVSTIAGSAGVSGSTNGLGQVARFSSPRGITIDAADNIFVADFGNHVVRKITPSGEVSTFAGAEGQDGKLDGSAGTARFKNPTRLAFDSLGVLYLTDQNQTVRKISKDGFVSTFLTFSDVSSSVATLFGVALSGIAVDSVGQVYVSDYEGGTVRRFNANGDAMPWATGDGFVHLRLPADLAIDAAGNVLVACAGSIYNSIASIFLASSVEKISPSGQIQTVAGLTGSHAFGDTASQYGFVDGASTSALFNKPKGIAVGAQREIYVADQDNFAIRKIDVNGMVNTVAGGTSAGNKDGQSIQARFNNLLAIATSPNGSLVVTDSNNSVRTIDLSGKVTTQSFQLPTGEQTSQFPGSLSPLAFDTSGTLWLQNNQRLGDTLYSSNSSNQLSENKPSMYLYGITANPQGGLYVRDFQTVLRRSPEGVLAPFATGFSAISSMIVDSAGNLYVGEAFDCTVSVIAGTGELRFIAGAKGDCRYQDGLAQAARFEGRLRLAADDVGNVYISDASQKLRKLSPDGTVSTLVGTPNQNQVKLGLVPESLTWSVGAMTWSKGALYGLASNSILKFELPTP